MSKKHTPCAECRKYGRKCVQINLNAPCLRCERLTKVCLRSNDSLDPNDEFDIMRGEVECLTLTINDLEKEMKSLSKCKRADLPQALIDTVCSKWKIKIQNGHFSIETGIQYLSQLLRYQEPIRYLSPINMHSDVEKDNTIIAFKTSNHGDLYGLVGKIIAKGSTFKQQTKMLETPLCGSWTIMDQFINIFFTCHNAHLGWLYEPTFRERYKHIKTPINDLICVAICCHVCASPCDHLDFTTRQRKDMSDFFFSRTKDIFFEQFDEPSKRLENLIAINLLFQYVHMTIKFMEYDTLVTISYHISLDLKAEYDKIDSPSTIDYTLFTRNFASNYCVRIFVDNVVDKAITQQPLPFPKIKVLPDEPECVAKSLEIQNWILHMHGHSFTDKLLEKVHLIYRGVTCTLSLETIFRVDEIILEHQKTIPNKWNLCEDIYDEEQCKKAIDKSSDVFAIIVFINFSIFVLDFYSSFLEPVTLDSENPELLHSIRQHSLERARKTANLSIYGLNKIAQMKNSPCCYQLTLTDLVLYVSSSLVLLCSSQEDQNALEARKMFQCCCNMICKLQNIKENDIPSQMKMDKSDIKEFIRNHKVDISYYSSYPHPWCALMGDLSQFI